MAQQIYNLTFQKDMFHRPILHTLGKRFRLTINFRRAMLGEEGGWAEVEFEGSEEEVGRAVADLLTTGVNITGPLTDLVEPDPDHIPARVGRGM